MHHFNNNLQKQRTQLVSFLNLEYKFVDKNSIDLISKVNHIQLLNNTKPAYFDICKCYTNVLVDEIIIIKNRFG